MIIRFGAANDTITPEQKWAFAQQQCEKQTGTKLVKASADPAGVKDFICVKNTPASSGNLPLYIGLGIVLLILMVEK